MARGGKEVGVVVVFLRGASDVRAGECSISIDAFCGAQRARTQHLGGCLLRCAAQGAHRVHLPKREERGRNGLDIFPGANDTEMW